ncbi:hypothetical protein ILYODFUR_029506 [Ilyodon furcidens]|uniref:Secreted protein n=1 Tax=Ilyodon furcidens TaxID=33524 RepID=A0ABV0U0G0_9TELE
MCPSLSLSLLFSTIHAYVGLKSRRTQLCCCLCRTTGVFLAQERSQRKLHAVMKRCFAVVNSSESEGMSAAILEVNICKVTVQKCRGFRKKIYFKVFTANFFPYTISIVNVIKIFL